MKLLLARHGQTRWNIKEIFRGRADIELDETGVRQAELLAEYLKEAPLDAIYSSPLKRAFATARTAGACHGLEVTVSPGLIDMDFGDWEGLSVAEVKHRFPAQFREWAQHPERLRLPGGESLEDIRKRALEVFKDAAGRYRRDVLFVSHRVVHKVLICALLGLDDSHFWNIRMDTCGLTTFALEAGRLILTEHNNTSYLAPLKGSNPPDF